MLFGYIQEARAEQSIAALTKKLTIEAAVMRSGKVNRLLDKKYSLVKKIFGLVSALQGRKDAILEIKPGE